MGLLDAFNPQTEVDPYADPDPRTGLLGLWNRDQSQGLMNISAILAGLSTGQPANLAGVMLQQNTLAEARQKRTKKQKLAMRLADKISDPEIAEAIRGNPDLIDEYMGAKIKKELDPNTQYAKDFLGATDMNGQYPKEVLDKVRKHVAMPDITDAQAGMIARAAPGGPDAVNSIITKIVDDQRLGAAAEEKLAEQKRTQERIKRLFPTSSNEFTPEQLKGIGEEFGLPNPTAAEAARIRSGMQENDLTQVLNSLQTDREQANRDKRVQDHNDETNTRLILNGQRAAANSLGDDYRKSVEPFMKTYNAGVLAKDIAGQDTSKWTGAQQMSTLYRFITALDPDSVVREGEVSLGREMSNYIDRVKTQISKITENNLLPPETMKEITDELIRYAKMSESIIRNKKKNLLGSAKTQQVPTDMIFGLDSYNKDLDGPGTFDTPEQPAGGDGGWQEIGGVKVRLKPGQ